LTLLFCFTFVTQAVLLRKKKVEIWPDLVASPSTFNKLLARLKVSGFKFVDVFDATAIPQEAQVHNGRQWFTDSIGRLSRVNTSSLLC